MYNAQGAELRRQAAGKIFARRGVGLATKKKKEEGGSVGKELLGWGAAGLTAITAGPQYAPAAKAGVDALLSEGSGQGQLGSTIMHMAMSDKYKKAYMGVSEWAKNVMSGVAAVGGA